MQEEASHLQFIFISLGNSVGQISATCDFFNSSRFIHTISHYITLRGPGFSSYKKNCYLCCYFLFGPNWSVFLILSCLISFNSLYVLLQFDSHSYTTMILTYFLFQNKNYWFPEPNIEDGTIMVRIWGTKIIIEVNWAIIWVSRVTIIILKKKKKYMSDHN